MLAGELALLEGEGRRTATVVCVTPCFFGVLGKKEYNSVLRSDRERALKSVTDFYAKIPFFSELRNDARVATAHVSTARSWGKGDVIFMTGDEVRVLVYCAHSTCM